MFCFILTHANRKRNSKNKMFTVVQLFITSFEGCIYLLTIEQKQEIHNGTNIRYSGIYNKYQLSYRNIEEMFRNK